MRSNFTIIFSNKIFFIEILSTQILIPCEFWLWPRSILQNRHNDITNFRIWLGWNWSKRKTTTHHPPTVLREENPKYFLEKKIEKVYIPQYTNKPVLYFSAFLFYFFAILKNNVSEKHFQKKLVFQKNKVLVYWGKTIFFLQQKIVLLKINCLLNFPFVKKRFLVLPYTRHVCVVEICSFQIWPPSKGGFWGVYFFGFFSSIFEMRS